MIPTIIIGSIGVCATLLFLKFRKSYKKSDTTTIPPLSSGRPEIMSTVTPKQVSSDHLVAKGRSYLDSGDYHKALNYLTSARKADPKNAEIDNMIGVIYSDKDDNDSAIHFYLSAINKNPDNSYYYSNLGDAYYMKNDDTRAMDSMNKACSMNPDNSDNYYDIGRILNDEGEYPEAIENLKMAVKLFHDDSSETNTLSNCYRDLAIAYYYDQLYNKSLKAIKHVTNHSSVDYSIIGSDYYALNQFSKSLHAVRKAINLDHHNDSAFSLAGQLFDKAHNYKQGFKMLMIAHKLDPSYIFYATDAVQACYYDGNVDKAISLAKSFTYSFKGNKNICYLYDTLGSFYMSENDLPKCHDAFKKSLSINPNDALTYDYIGDLLKHHNDLNEATKYYRHAVACDSSNDQYYADLGNAYFNQHNYASATAEYESAIKHSNINNLNFDPNNFMIALFKSRQNVTMNKLFNQLDHSYWNGITYRMIGRNYYNGGDYKDAIPFFRQATLLDDSDDNAFSDLGEAYAQLNDRQLALKCYQKASSLNSLNSFYTHQINALTQRA